VGNCATVSKIKRLQLTHRDQAAALDWTKQYEARAIMVHAAQCFACRSLLEHDEEIRRRLALLRDHEPAIDVLQQVMQRIDTEGNEGTRRSPHV
jgi:hypothetical protein